MSDSIFIRGEGGSIFKLDLPLHESIQDRMLKGYIVRVANAEGDPYDGADKVAPDWRPAVSDSKAAWVGFAVANGMTPDDAEALTKTDIIERFGNTPTPDPEPEPVDLEAVEASQVPGHAG